jgi:hypothetical protein
MGTRGGLPRLSPGAMVCAAAGVLAVGLLLIVLSRPSSSSGAANPIELVHGVPVGVRDTPPGVLAAADNYVALASQSLEQNPAVFAALVAEVYLPAARGEALSQAQELRASDAQNMGNYRSGGHGIAVVAARRLDRYTPSTATVTTWLGGFVWGPQLAPRQTWNLVDTTLRWQADRWLVVSMNADRTPAPVPSLVYVQGNNNHAGAFARLAGMSAPFYGSAE